MNSLSCREPDKNLKIGKIIEVDGNHIKAELEKSIDELTRIYNAEVYTIGQYGSILKSYFGSKLLFMYVTRLRMKSEVEAERGVITSPSEDSRILEADLFGEGVWKISCDSLDSKCILKFERGISTYPLPQQEIYITTSTELQSIYECKDREAIKIGTYVGSGSIPCLANVNELFSKHTAVLGSIGSGKSATVAAIIHAILGYNPGVDEENKSKPWHPHIVILDPHNEYNKAFPEAHRLVSDEGSLKLPYWLMNLQELIDLFIGKTEFQATSQTNILKMALIEARKEGITKIGFTDEEISVDSPIPFSLDTLIAKINEDKNKYSASKQDKHENILNKIDLLKRDVRLKFLMDNWVSDQDEIKEVVSQFISAEKTLKIVDLSGIPNDVAGIVSSTIARLLFMYKLWETSEERKKDPVLLVCEEAHRYVPNRGEAEYSAAQDAVKRVAKEGRKYGLGLMLISQRPSEIEPTVLSQCNSWLVLRLTNGDDQAYVMKFLPDSLSSLGKILPGLRRREAIFIGQAATIPSRVLINELNPEQLPCSNDISFIEGWSSDFDNANRIQEIANRWRIQLRSPSEGTSKEVKSYEE
jgi:DNA helicase HerA-like ATPase